jgi:glycerol-3-phosphate dehydrogenase
VVRSAQGLGARSSARRSSRAATLFEDGVELRFRRDASEQRLPRARARSTPPAPGPTRSPSHHPAIPVPALECVQGAHIVLPGSARARHLLPREPARRPRAVRDAVARPAHDRHHRDALSRRSGRCRAHHAEIHYLLGVLKHYFPRYRARLTPDDISQQLRRPAGAAGGAGHAFHRSRETMLVPDRAARPRVLSIYGGKLTTYRAVAHRALQRSPPRCRSARAGATDQLPLTPGP